MSYNFYKENAEEKLYQTLLVEKQKTHPSMALLLCNFFQIGLSWSDNDTKILEQVFANFKDLDIYLCQDGDLIFSYPVSQLDNLNKIIDIVTENHEATITKYMEIQDFFETYNHHDSFEKLRLRLYKKLGNITKSAEKLKDMMADHKLIDVLKNTFKLISMQRTFRNKPHILLVEDQIFSQKLVKLALSDYIVHIAPTSADAIVAYMEKCPDIVLLDVELPDIDGHDLGHIINTIDENSFITMITANNSQEDVLKAKNNHVERFISKPFQQEELLKVITLFQKRKQKNNDKSNKFKKNH